MSLHKVETLNIVSKRLLDYGFDLFICNHMVKKMKIFISFITQKILFNKLEIGIQSNVSFIYFMMCLLKFSRPKGRYFHLFFSITKFL